MAIGDTLQLINGQFPLQGTRGAFNTLDARIDALAGPITFDDSDRRFESRAALESARIVGAGTTVSSVWTDGGLLPGDGGGGHYKWVALEPAHGGKVRSADGEWWELVPGGEYRLRQFGVTGSGDETARFDGAVKAALDSGLPLVIDVDCAVDCTRQTHDTAGRTCFMILTGDLILEYRGGSLSAKAVSSVSSSIFAIDGTSGTVSLELYKVRVGGATAHRFIEATPNSTIARFVAEGVRTALHGMHIGGEVTQEVRAIGNILGEDVTATSGAAPQLDIAPTNTLSDNYTYLCRDNEVYGGTSTVGGLIRTKHMPVGAVVHNNKSVNLGGSASQGFDLDNIGAGVSVNDNTAIGCGFELKVGNDGHDYNKEVQFNNNISWNSNTHAFSIRCSCVGDGNIAYNPNGWRLRLWNRYTGHAVEDVGNRAAEHAHHLRGRGQFRRRAAY